MFNGTKAIAVPQISPFCLLLPNVNGNLCFETETTLFGESAKKDYLLFDDNFQAGQSDPKKITRYPTLFTLSQLTTQNRRRKPQVLPRKNLDLKNPAGIPEQVMELDGSIVESISRKDRMSFSSSAAMYFRRGFGYSLHDINAAEAPIAVLRYIKEHLLQRFSWNSEEGFFTYNNLKKRVYNKLQEETCWAGL